MKTNNPNHPRQVIVQVGSGNAGYWGIGTTVKDAREQIKFPQSPRTPTMVYIVYGCTPDKLPDIDGLGRFGFYEGQHVTRLAMQWQAVKMMDLHDIEG